MTSPLTEQRPEVERPRLPDHLAETPHLSEASWTPANPAHTTPARTAHQGWGT